MKISNKTLITIIACFVLAVAALCVLVYTGSKPGTQVKVTVNGTQYGLYDLHSAQTVRIETALGYNVLTIRNGRASVTESDCDNQICVHTPALTQETVGIIVCLPHGLAVELREKQ